MAVMGFGLAACGPTITATTTADPVHAVLQHEATQAEQAATPAQAVDVAQTVLVTFRSDTDPTIAEKQFVEDARLLVGCGCDSAAKVFAVAARGLL